MAQQLNLFDARFAPARQRFTARQGLMAAACTLLLGWGGAQGLHWATARALAETQAAQAGLAAMRGQVTALAPADSAGAQGELARLRALEANQRRVRAALDAGAAGVREGHAEHLVALARQASGQLWLTGLSVSEDGSAIALEGRMTDTSVLAGYLRRLNAEPRFKGRPFAQLELKSVDGNGGSLPYTEFVLRSAAQTAPGAGTPADSAGNGNLGTTALPAGTSATLTTAGAKP